MLFPVASLEEVVAVLGNIVRKCELGKVTGGDFEDSSHRLELGEGRFCRQHLDDSARQAPATNHVATFSAIYKSRETRAFIIVEAKPGVHRITLGLVHNWISPRAGSPCASHVVSGPWHGTRVNYFAFSVQGGLETSSQRSTNQANNRVGADFFNFFEHF